MGTLMDAIQHKLSLSVEALPATDTDEQHMSSIRIERTM